MTPENKSEGIRGRCAREYMGAVSGKNHIDKKPKEQIVEIIRELYLSGLITTTGGNLSTRTVDNMAIWITPSQIHKGNLNSDMLVCIDLEGKKLDNTPLKPSSEKFVHIEIYKAFPEIRSVIHAHAPYSTSLVLSGLPFLPINTEAALIGELPRIPFIMSGTQELARAVVQAMIPNKNHLERGDWNPAVLMQNHGIVVAASNLRIAANILESIERTSQLIITCYSSGIEPTVLPDEVVREIRNANKWIA
jgi:L-ribulose-5-phosphate 4-epimerase